MRLAAMMLGMVQTISAASLLMYVGTYTEHGSKGIYAYRFDEATGKASELGLVAETPSPSWLAQSPNHKVVYVANELTEYQGLKSGAVSAWEMDKSTGKLKQLSIAPSRGGAPCHVITDPTGKFVYVANYFGGNVARFPVKLDGSLAESDKFVQHEAKGSATPHAHEVVIAPDGKSLFVMDLGLDQVISYDLELNRLGEVTGKLGAGPRHLAFHPSHKNAFLINELDSTVTTFGYDGRKLMAEDTVSSVAPDFAGKKSSAEIAVHPSGKFLYASNRGGDTIAMFPIAKGGKLGPSQQFPAGGKTPRSFTIDPSGKWMLVANQDSNNIVVYKIDKGSGKLTASGNEIKLSMPVRVLFIQ